MPSRFAFISPSTAFASSSVYFQNIGCLAAFPFAPYLTDGLGRRAAILFGATLMIIATALQTASNSVGMFIGARYFCLESE